MGIFDLLYGSVWVILCSALMAGFGICFFLRREKKDLLLALLFAVYLLYELVGNLFNYIPGLRTDFSSPRYFVSVLIQAALTFVYICVIAEQSGSPLGRGEKCFLIFCSAAVFSLSLRPFMRDKYAFFLCYTFYWGVWRLFRVRRESGRSRVMFRAVLAIAVIQTLSLLTVFSGSELLAAVFLRPFGPFDLFLPGEAIGYIVLFISLADLVCNFRRYFRDSRATCREELFTVSPDALARAAGLTKREAEIFGLLARGRSNSSISQVLFITEGTVKVHVHNIYRKLGVANRSQINALLTGEPHRAAEDA